jgi:hypothetical protein
MDDVCRLRSVIDRSSGIIRTLLASARPRPIEHPTMAAAWAEARIYLGDAGDES